MPSWLGRLVKLARILRNRQFARELLGVGVAAGVEHQEMLLRVAARHVIDVGANRGQFTLATAVTLPEAHIDAFEPLADARECLVMLHIAPTRLTLHPFAIGKENVTATLHRTRRDDSSSLLPPTELQVSIFPGTDEVGRETVQIRRLDGLLSLTAIARPSLLKIDVQGSELDVIKGAWGILPVIDWVYVECSFVELYKNQPLAHDIVSILDAAGFVIDGLYNPVVMSGHGCVQADILFRKET